MVDNVCRSKRVDELFEEHGVLQEHLNNAGRTITERRRETQGRLSRSFTIFARYYSIVGGDLPVGSYTQSAVIATLAERCGIFVEVHRRRPPPAALYRVAAVRDARLQYATCVRKDWYRTMSS